jgi:hypothetical protein
VSARPRRPSTAWTATWATPWARPSTPASDPGSDELSGMGPRPSGRGPSASAHGPSRRSLRQTRCTQRAGLRLRERRGCGWRAAPPVGPPRAGSAAGRRARRATSGCDGD